MPKRKVDTKSKSRNKLAGRFYPKSIFVMLLIVIGAFILSGLSSRQYNIAIDTCGRQPVRVYDIYGTYLRPEEAKRSFMRYASTSFTDGLFMIGTPFYCSEQEAQDAGYRPIYKKEKLY